MKRKRSGKEWRRKVQVNTVGNDEGRRKGYNEQPEKYQTLKQGNWVNMEIAIDSGAGESVAPPGMPGTSKIRTSRGMKEGVTYAAAAGKLIKNEGEFDLLWND